jgi:hypothetical protein
MNKLNDIFKMISQMEKNAEEVKLGKHEVKLGLVDDIKSSIAFLNKDTLPVMDKFWDAYETVKNFQSLLKQNVSLFDKVEKDINNLQSQTKLLGIDTPPEILKSLPKLQKDRQSLNRILNIKL